MEVFKKKEVSVGIKIFGYLGIIIGLYFIALSVFDFSLEGILMGSVYVIFSWNLLRLNNWSRLLLIVFNSIFALFAIIFAAVTIVAISYMIELGVPLIEALNETCISYTSAFKEGYQDYAYLVLIGYLVSAIYNFGFIIYFIRPKTKKEFKQ